MSQVFLVSWLYRIFLIDLKGHLMLLCRETLQGYLIEKYYFVAIIPEYILNTVRFCTEKCVARCSVLMWVAKLRNDSTIKIITHLLLFWFVINVSVV